MRKIFSLWLVIVSYILLSACSETVKKTNSGGLNDKTAINKNTVPEVNELVTPVPYKSEQVTKANFQKIKNGMTFTEVEILFEDSGKKISNDENTDKGETVYEFLASDGKGKAIITFKDEKVVKKEQLDLK